MFEMRTKCTPLAHPPYVENKFPANNTQLNQWPRPMISSTTTDTAHAIRKKNSTETDTQRWTRSPLASSQMKQRKRSRVTPPSATATQLSSKEFDITDIARQADINDNVTILRFAWNAKTTRIRITTPRPWLSPHCHTGTCNSSRLNTSL